MNINHCVIARTPKHPENHNPHNEQRHPDHQVPDLRGQIDLYSAGARETDMRPHPNRAGVVDTRLRDADSRGHDPDPAVREAVNDVDPRAHDPDWRVRAAYCQEIARLMIERDGLDAVTVDRFMRLNVAEYGALFAPQPGRPVLVAVPSK
jgi:hypothetical protein